MIKNFVDNTVISNTDKVTVSAFQLFLSGWSWIIGKAVNNFLDIGIIRLIDFFKSFNGSFF
ncbi:MAG: hypothetical protein ACOYOA_09360 [Saprospiraceae bacterium]